MIARLRGTARRLALVSNARVIGEAAGHGFGIVGAAVIDDDQLPVSETQRLRALDRAGETMRAIARRRNDRNRRRGKAYLGGFGARRRPRRILNEQALQREETAGRFQVLDRGKFRLNSGNM